MNDHDKDAITDVPQLVQQWRQGDQEAATLLYNRYQNRLLMLVSGHLSEKLSRRLEAEDLVISTFRSAFRVTSQQDIQYQDEQGFWKWLVTIALNKTFKRIERETAGKRNPNRETGGDSVLGERILNDPTPDDVVQASELLQKILERLDDKQALIVLGKLNGLSHAEIAAEIGAVTKTVQRHGQAIRQAAMEVLGDNAPQWLLDESPFLPELYAACLGEPVTNWLPENFDRAASDLNLTLGGLFELDTPDPQLLNAVRGVAKERGDESPSNVLQLICAAIYMLAIATARVKLGTNLSSNSDRTLANRASVILKKPWIDKATATRLRQFLKVVEV